MEPSPQKPEISGVLVIDKPAGITSHDVVARVRKILHQRQVGHFGTLDPFATGVLPVSVGKATRFAQYYLKSRKAYEGTIRFGFSTDTYDATGEPATEASPVALEASELERQFRGFTGRLLQAPPPFSAKRVGGVRAYQLARQHKPVNLTPVEVEIYALELLSIQGEQVIDGWIQQRDVILCGRITHFEYDCDLGISWPRRAIQIGARVSNVRR